MDYSECTIWVSYISSHKEIIKYFWIGDLEKPDYFSSFSCDQIMHITAAIETEDSISFIENIALVF